MKKTSRASVDLGERCESCGHRLHETRRKPWLECEDISGSVLVAKDAPEPFPLDGSEPHAHMVAKGGGERGNELRTCDGRLKEVKPKWWRNR